MLIILIIFSKKCEIIVCDHGSTDNTQELMKKYQDKVIYIRREVDYGIHFTWLDGIIIATSDLIHINYEILFLLNFLRYL